MNEGIRQIRARLAERDKVVSPFDSLTRPSRADHELNMIAARLFSNGQGREFMNYLITITMRAAGPPGMSNEALQHFEGQRWLVSMIQQRIKAGQKGPMTYDFSALEPDSTPAA